MTESPLTPEQLEQIVAVAMDMARDGRTADLVEFLDHGFPLDQQDPAGNTLVMLAAYHGHLDTVATLVDRGADVDRRNDRDQSPVAGAMFKGEDEVVRALVAAGADLDAGSPTARATAEVFGQQHLIDGEDRP
jgi:ankyrin repeat protein